MAFLVKKQAQDKRLHSQERWR